MDFEFLEKEDFSVWFTFGDAEVEIRYISRDKMREIGQQAKKFIYRNHQKLEEFDDLKADILLGRAAVKDWRGFTMKGEPLPCTPENIDLLMTKWNAFARFVNDTCGDIDMLVKQEHEAAKKNSLNTSGQG